MNLNLSPKQTIVVSTAIAAYGAVNYWACYESSTGRMNLTEVLAIHIGMCYVTFVMAVLALVKSSERKP